MCSRLPIPANLRAISAWLCKSRYFLAFFAVLSLRSPLPLAIVLSARVFASINRGILAACLGFAGVDRKKIRRISRINVSQANEQDEECVQYRREGRHTEENQRAIL